MELDNKIKRTLLTIGLFAMLAVFFYIYFFELVLFITLICGAWLAFNFIETYTKETIDPTGKYVFVTGCDSGLGLASAKALRDYGFGVIAGCYDDNSDGAKELKGRPWVKKIEVVSLDVTSVTSVSACVKEVEDICRDQGLWAVINNAGINDTGPVELTTMERYHKVAGVNLFGAIRVTKAVLSLVRQAQGRVVNMTSERGFNAWKGNSNYCMTKFGLETFSACLRKEMERFNVKVITVAPGSFGAATKIATEKGCAELRDLHLQARASLSQDDQQLYTEESIDQTVDAVLKIVDTSCPTAKPVSDACIDAVSNMRPQRCYIVHGMARKYIDPYCVCAHIRPFLPERVMSVVESFILLVLS